LDYWGTTTPNSSFAFPTGQAISRTTYAALFALIGATYGVGDGTTTFNLPDKTGRVSAMKRRRQRD
jgi:microcystin-dependent protein